jgi:hypothetical protein
MTARAAHESVLDESGEARFVKRLFIADNAALPKRAGRPEPDAQQPGASHPHSGTSLRSLLRR